MNEDRPTDPHPDADPDQSAFDTSRPALGAPRPKSQTSVLGAAMLAVGKIIEPEKTQVTVTSEAPSGPESDDWLDLDFGDLPEL